METTMPHLSTSETEDCQKRFQAAVAVIQNLPKNGTYRPSYEVMLRFYGLYKQAVCGPCKVSRPGFWDPVGRYKWDAWHHLGDMSCENAMAAYVNEMKKVAQEVIDSMPINEKMASFYHYFEPLYHVIHDMPRPPKELLSLRADINANEQTASQSEEGLDTPREEMDQHLEGERECVPNSEPLREAADPALSEGLVLTSDSESEIFCDSVEQLDNIKVTQMGAGQGGEGDGDGRVPPLRKRDPGREGTRHGRGHPGETLIMEVHLTVVTGEKGSQHSVQEVEPDPREGPKGFRTLRCNSRSFWPYGGSERTCGVSWSDWRWSRAWLQLMLKVHSGGLIWN
ncbi:acyl-CoA-binding domain-containing protein 4 isoform X3 [Brachyhypopomus gauderio]|uniref:acyl-CoA-binding domain-containing protein 4 isoform X3 n=1 Tax=Brachyhypopomus gauderio TaxID=698409 RepID=UPI004042B430